MEVHARGAEDGAGGWRKDGGGGFEEEERFLRTGIVEFFDVIA